MNTTYAVTLTVSLWDGPTQSTEYPAQTPQLAAFVVRTRTRVLALAEDKWAPVWLWLDTGSQAMVTSLAFGEVVYLAWELVGVRARAEWTVRPVLDGATVQGPARLAPMREAVR